MRLRAERRRDLLGELAWVRADLLRQLERDIGGVITVLGVPWTLDGYGVGDDGDISTAPGDEVQDGLTYDERKFSWGHGVLSYW